MMNEDILLHIAIFSGDLQIVNNLIRTSSQFYHRYSDVINYVSKYRILSSDDLRKIPFGVDRFLRYHPEFFGHVNEKDYIKILVHDVRDPPNNINTIYQIIIQYESERCKELRRALMNSFSENQDYKCYLDTFGARGGNDIYDRFSKIPIEYIDHFIDVMIMNNYDINDIYNEYLEAIIYGDNDESINLEILSKLLEHDTLNTCINQQIDSFGTVLHYAADIGDKHLIQYLLDCGANINSPNRDYDYDRVLPIFYAVENDNLNIVKLLISNGAYIDRLLFSKKLSSDMSKLLEEYINSYPDRVYPLRARRRYL